MSLLFFLVSCASKHELPKREILTFSYEQVQKYMDLQKRCDMLIWSAESKYIIFSNEFHEERKDFLKELEIYFPWAEYPRSLDRCVSELQSP